MFVSYISSKNLYFWYMGSVVAVIGCMATAAARLDHILPGFNTGAEMFECFESERAARGTESEKLRLLTSCTIWSRGLLMEYWGTSEMEYEGDLGISCMISWTGDTESWGVIESCFMLSSCGESRLVLTRSSWGGFLLGKGRVGIFWKSTSGSWNQKQLQYYHVYSASCRMR